MNQQPAPEGRGVYADIVFALNGLKALAEELETHYAGIAAQPVLCAQAGRLMLRSAVWGANAVDLHHAIVDLRGTPELGRSADPAVHAGWLPPHGPNDTADAAAFLAGCDRAEEEAAAAYTRALLVPGLPAWLRLLLSRHLEAVHAHRRDGEARPATAH